VELNFVLRSVGSWLKKINKELPKERIGHYLGLSSEGTELIT